MEKQTVKITIYGNDKEVKTKAKALAILSGYLDGKTLEAFAKVVQTEPSKVKLAKQFLGI